MSEFSGEGALSVPATAGSNLDVHWEMTLSMKPFLCRIFTSDWKLEVLPRRKREAGERRPFLRHPPHGAMVTFITDSCLFVQRLVFFPLGATSANSLGPSKLSLCVRLCSYQLRIECMLLCEETLSVLDMLKPKVALVEEACQCEYSTSRWSWIHYLKIWN